MSERARKFVVEIQATVTIEMPKGFTITDETAKEMAARCVSQRYEEDSGEREYVPGKRFYGVCKGGV